MGKAEFAKFLPHLTAYYPGERLLVIHDRGAHHRGAVIEEVIRDACDRVVLKPQPAYSPELNPRERIWKWLRRVITHNHWFATPASKSLQFAIASAIWLGSKLRYDGSAG